MTVVAEPRAFAIDPRTARFLGCVLLVSLVPWLTVPLLPWSARAYAPSAIDTIMVLAVVNVIHVGMTGFFWIDHRYRAHIASRLGWFYLAPALVTIVSLGAVIIRGGTGFALITDLNTAWLLYHFTKQNWGLLSLTATATRAPRLQRSERWLYMAGALGGTLGLVQSQSRDVTILLQSG